jgi:hypothetical protein
MTGLFPIAPVLREKYILHALSLVIRFQAVVSIKMRLEGISLLA